MGYCAMVHDGDDELFDPNLEFDLASLAGSASLPPPDCPMCDEPMKWIDGAYMCNDCNGMDCGPETG
ncbi:MAG: hypothetical protein CMH81_00010 [Nitrospiraceae bacterium]|jgi:hypothetical protein|nr:hypothetical protein [Nitrospiraceae bacterium]|tara:strand:+ start:5113 stop:5313 length:201 start_codon:yes stop_codon:yes gene_type:complete